jgi:hypothetical protein
MTKHDADKHARESEPMLGITWIYDIRATLGSECALRHTRCIEMCRRIAEGPTWPIDTGKARVRVRHQNWWAPLLVSGFLIFCADDAFIRFHVLRIALRFFVFFHGITTISAGQSTEAPRRATLVGN